MDAVDAAAAAGAQEAKEEAKVREEQEKALREVRKLVEPRFDGTTRSFTIWRKKFLMTLKSYELDDLVASTAMTGEEVKETDVANFKKKLRRYLSTMNIVRGYLVRLLPDEYTAQALGLPGVTRDEVLEDCTMTEAIRRRSNFRKNSMKLLTPAQFSSSSAISFKRLPWPRNSNC